MKVTREIVTVLSDPAAGEVNVVLSGFRITLTADEAFLLANGLARCLAQRREPATAETSGPAESEDAAVESEPAQQRTRALIQASIRDKGLSLRDEQRTREEQRI